MTSTAATRSLSVTNCQKQGIKKPILSESDVDRLWRDADSAYVQTMGAIPIERLAESHERLRLELKSALATILTKDDR